MSKAEKYVWIDHVGDGFFSSAHIVKSQDGKILCRKDINYAKMPNAVRKQLEVECAILSSLEHPNIVRYYDHEYRKSKDLLYLYMEYCENGDLGSLIKDLIAKKKVAQEGFVWKIFSQLVTALYRCHYGVNPPEVGNNFMELGGPAETRKPESRVVILHRDLKPENVFLGEKNLVKLGDFGLSKLMQSNDLASTYLGTPLYMSPEIHAKKQYTLKSDIWSLGCIIYQLCAREPPFNGKSLPELEKNIKRGKPASLPTVYSSELKNVINHCLTVDPNQRPDTAPLLNFVKLMTKEKEIIDKIRRLKSDEAQMRKGIEISVQQEWELKAQLEIKRRTEVEFERLQKKFDQEVRETQMRKKFEISVQQEWELKAQLEIKRRTEVEFERLQKKFDQEVREKVESDLQKRSSLGGAVSINTLSNSREEQQTPMDVETAQRSSISIAAQPLSPGPKEATNSTRRNIFAITATAEARGQLILLVSDDPEKDSRSAVISQTTASAFNRQLINIFAGPANK